MMIQIERLLSRHSDLLALCDALEAVADGLPRPPLAQRCRDLARALPIALQAAHWEENVVLFPLLAEANRPEFTQSAARLRREHDADLLAADEISETLLAMADTERVHDAAASGYMLRSFFEAVRRRVHAERDIIALLTRIHSPGPA